MPNQTNKNRGISSATSAETKSIRSWVTGTFYKVSEEVIESGKIYTVLIEHTSDVFATDLSAGKWVEISADIATLPGGADTQVQFNNAGAFGGSANFTWNNGTQLLAVIGDVDISQHMAVGSTATISSDRILTLNDAITSSNSVQSIQSSITYTPTNNTRQGIGLDINAIMAGAVGGSDVIGANIAAPNFVTAGTSPNLIALRLQVATGPGAIAPSNTRALEILAPSLIGTDPTNLEGINIANQGNAGVTTSAAINIEDQSGSTNNFAITTGTGEIGFGILAPVTNVHILEANTDIVPAVEIEQTSTGDAALQFSIPGDSYAMGIDNSGGDRFKISYAAVAGAAVLGINDRFVIDASGNIGFGINPINRLDISGSLFQVMQITTTSSTSFAAIAVNSDVGVTNIASFKNFGTANGGTTFGLPNAKLATIDKAGSGNMAIGTVDGGFLVLGTNNIERVRITTLMAVTGQITATAGVDISASQAFSVAGTNILSDAAGTMTLSNIDALDATTESTIEAAIDTLANLTAASALVTVGALNSGSITSGFGNIDNGSSNITTSQLNSDNLRLDGNTLSSEDVNGLIKIIPNGTGRTEVIATPGTVIGGFASGGFHITSPSASVNGNSVITGHNSFGGNKQLWYLGSVSSSNDNIAFINRQNATLSLNTNNLTRLTIEAAGNVGIGISGPTARLHVVGVGTTSSTFAARFADSADATLFVVRDDVGVFVGISGASLSSRFGIGGNKTANAWGLEGIVFNSNETTSTDGNTAASGTVSNAIFNSFATPTFDSANGGAGTEVTATRAATLYVDGPPVPVTDKTLIINAYSIWVNNGDVRFDGSLLLNNATVGDSGVGVLAIKNGTAPTTSPVDIIQIYSADHSGAGTATLHMRNEEGDIIKWFKGAALTAEDATAIDSTYDATEEAVLNNVRTRLGEVEARLQALVLLT